MIGSGCVFTSLISIFLKNFARRKTGIISGGAFGLYCHLPFDRGRLMQTYPELCHSLPIFPQGIPRALITQTRDPSPLLPYPFFSVPPILSMFAPTSHPLFTLPMPSSPSCSSSSSPTPSLSSSFVLADMFHSQRQTWSPILSLPLLL